MKTAGSMTLMISVGLMVVACNGVAKPQAAHPDYTKGEKLQRTENLWNMGPTGIAGYFWSDHGTKQIPVNTVETGSPADGLIKKNDVIVGLAEGRFTNARQELIQAVMEAEQTDGGGKITLNVWRPEPGGKPGEGKYLQVPITVPFMGAYSDTSPWNCPKTEAIIDKAAQHIVNAGLGKSSIPNDLNALGLLATGEEKYLPLVREYAHMVGDPDNSPHMGTWHASYRNLFLTEYYLATKDDYVLPSIKKLSEFLATGVSGVGTWSHGVADVKKNGMYGPPGAYGAMNQCSITSGLSLIMAQKCGIKSPVIDKAVDLAIHFLVWFIDKGTIPYGDHTPNTKDHDNNGRNSQAAVMFDLYGHTEGANYLTRMTLASYDRRDFGHTGHFFSGLWGPLGAARGGEEAAGHFIRNTRYYTELERHIDGRFTYQGSSSYTDWDNTGARLIAFCLPRQALFITGKGGSTIKPIAGDALKTVVDAATFEPKRSSVEQLLEALGSWSPIVRKQAAKELGGRPENVVKQLIAMLDNPNLNARYGASLALRYAGRGSEEAVKALLDKVRNSESLNMRYHAVVALKHQSSRNAPNGLGDAVKVAGPELLHIAGALDIQADPYGKLNKLAAEAFFSGGHAKQGKGFPNFTSDQVVTAMKAWLTNPNGECRSTAAEAYRYLSGEQLEKLWAYIYVAANEPAPTGVMFAGKGRQNSTILLAQHKFKEVLPLAVAYLVEDGWGKFGRVPVALEALSYYGSLVKPYMAFIEFEHESFQNRKGREVAKERRSYKRLMANIDKEPNLKSIKPYLKAAGIPYKKPNVKEILYAAARRKFGWETVGKPAPEDRVWRYMTLSQKPGMTYETLHTFNKIPFKDVAGADPALNGWYKPGFDDSGWKQGKAPIGDGPWRNADGSSEILPQTLWKNNDKYLLMRTTFEVEEAYYVKYDFRIVDTIGIKIYLNGKELFTPLYYWNKSPKYRSVPGYKGIQPIPVKKGTNVLAIYAYDPGRGPVMVDFYLRGLINEANFDPTPYYQEAEEE